ncbi:Sensory/regulatory protein RpfC [Prochlorococcus marinus str. MIT 1342]|uniref:response regulator n=1 Tax=Prochlorococcus TaxID=1218 RepID=UPI0007B3D020|nr:response regulator [Prochlorococcus marinus]KZR81853.1 Sensory/regulatory protein RpfC [Prochlorococcus marinus str. MIT 1342]
MNQTDSPNRIENSGKTQALTVAIVDDDPRVRELLKEEIQDEGHHVLSFESAETFLDNSSLESIDLVLLDLMMPGMNGLECLHQLHHLQACHDKLPRIVVVSALSDPSKQRQVLEAGAESYVIKPDLFERLPTLLNGSTP